MGNDAFFTIQAIFGSIKHANIDEMDWHFQTFGLFIVPKADITVPFVPEATVTTGGADISCEEDEDEETSHLEALFLSVFTG